ncbi:MAG: hypothetical protein SGI74_09790 [Oligoflexia bacterium]|nr:hypothetical protein [Oligoflexia bacterium]
MDTKFLLLGILSFAVIGLLGGLGFTLLLGDSRRRFPRNTEVALLSAIVCGSLSFFIPVLSPNELLAGIGFSFIGMFISLFLYWAAFHERSKLMKEVDKNPARSN